MDPYNDYNISFPCNNQALTMQFQVHFHDKSYLNAFHPAKLVYLTSDASYILDTLDPDKIYVIGGFVDHNLHKVRILFLISICISFSSK